MDQWEEIRQKTIVEMPLNDIYRGSLPMKAGIDGEGNPWICDHGVNLSADLSEEGCWQLREEGSTRIVWALDLGPVALR